MRLLAAFLRSVHELFWALLLLQITGLSPLTGILAIAIPYVGIFAKVYSELIEEADLSAERTLPPGASIVSRFCSGRLPVIAAQLKTYTLYRLECGHALHAGARLRRPADDRLPPGIPISRPAATPEPPQCCSASMG